MQRLLRSLTLILLVLLLVSCAPTPTPTAEPSPQPTAEITPEATAEATPAAVGTPNIAPVNATPAPARPVVTPGGDQTSTINDTPVAMPTFSPPPSLDDLLTQFPDLQPYLDQISGQVVTDIDFAELYTRIVAIYNEHGASGVAVFLQDSGLLERLNIPLSYLDLLTAYDSGGLQAVEELARTRRIINANDELSAYLALDSQDNLPAVTTSLQGLGVTVYDYLVNSDEVEIGIPLEVLAQYQTLGTLLDYLVSVANVEHVVGFRLPTPPTNDSFSLQQAFDSTGGEYVGGEAWNEAGFSGAGIRIGILDLGFGNLEDLLGDELPENVVANYDISRLSRDPVDHGTACAMVVHRMAPEAELYIAYYDGSYSAFLDALEFLRDNDVQIINHSVGSAVGPRDGTWGDAPIVDDFVRETGVLWVNAAGNSAQSYTSWEFNEGDDDMHDFGRDDYYLPFMAGAPFTSVIMNWDGNWDGREEDNYSFTIYDETGDEVVVAAESRRGRRNDYPFQGIAFASTPGAVYYISVTRERGDGENTFEIFVNNGLFPDWAQVQENTILVPGDARSVMTVGATGLTDDRLEDYSSQGPTPDDRIKPDISAPTGEVLPGYREGFFGTSGAAPLAAAAAALVLQRFPDMTAPEIMAYLMENSLDLGQDGEDPEFGAGRLQLPDPGIDPDESNPPTTDEPTAVVTDYSVDFGIKSDGELGMVVTLSFELQNFEGREVWAALLFLDTDGNPIEIVDEDYQIGDTVGTGTRVRVRSNNTSFSDISLFIPYEAIGDYEEGTELMYVVGIVDWSDEDEVVVLWESEPGYISFG
ncbi:MAG: S8 family serine peptidase [Chloroflexi bacterium]|nr:S8 family serine peptidase [Chloroflexota bacterium]